MSTVNDTRDSKQQAQQSASDNNSGIGKKAIAGVAAGVAAVGAGAVAADMLYNDNGDNVAQAANTTTPDAAAAIDQTPADSVDVNVETEPEAIVNDEDEPQETATNNTHTEHHHHHQENTHVDEHEHNPTPTPNPTVNDEGAFLRDNDVEVQRIETRETESGQSVHMASGTVNGHEAVFIDDGNGNVQIAAVDQNDNHELDENEVHDLSHDHVTMGNLANHLDDAVAVEPQPQQHDIHVVAVENDVDMDGHTVDVAAVSVDDNPVLMFDTDQNHEVDIVAVDANNNGLLDTDEAIDVSDQHFPMPTIDDVEGQDVVASTEMPDYSNDSDVDVYDI